MDQQTAPRYTNLVIGPYSGDRFEVQGDEMGPFEFPRTVKVAVFDTLAEAKAFIEQSGEAA